MGIMANQANSSTPAASPGLGHRKPDRTSAKKTKKTIAIALLAVLVSVLVLFAVYSVIDKKHPGEIDSKEEYLGNIETPAKQWLNGYLGVFFRFGQLGNINWLILPLLVWFFASKNIKKERWHWALLSVWLLTLAFIGFKGYYNFRYQLTLFPITSAMVLFLLWKLLENKHRVLKILCFSFIALLCIYNMVHYRDLYKNYWDLRVSVTTPHFPHRLMDYFKTQRFLRENTRVLTLNQPIFYYHTSLEGVDHISPHAIETWVEFNKKAGSIESRERLFQLIKRKLRCGYILLNQVQQRFQRADLLEEFLHCECRLEIEDQGWLLYRLRDKPLEKQLKNPAYRKPEVWNNSQTEVDTISPPLQRFFKSGKYKYEAGKDKKNNIIIVSPVSMNKKGDTRLHFGYEFNRKGLTIDPTLYDGKVVTLIARIAGSPSLLNRGNYIAVVDYNKDGSRAAEKTYFTSPFWRTYMVSRKVKPGNSRLILLFRFVPRAVEDTFKIMDVKIIVSEEPL